MRVLVIFIITLLVSSTLSAQIDKKTGFMGDPAAKRGGLIGYDEGRKQAKLDKEAGSPAASKNAESFNHPEKFHRAEYGSQASFILAFKRGFLIGYNEVYSGKKIDPKKLEQGIDQHANAQNKPTYHRVNVVDDAM
ncbi:MAG: hypothetical protein HYU97_12110 [Deltaproteobacteria bacterium]|nr:hypothetical protein [Deltaproteobacteria bacterium]